MCQHVGPRSLRTNFPFRVAREASCGRKSEQASGEAAKGSFLILPLALALARDLSRHLLSCDQAFFGLLPQKVFTDNRERACSHARYWGISSPQMKMRACSPDKIVFVVTV